MTQASLAKQVNGSTISTSPTASVLPDASSYIWPNTLEVSQVSKSYRRRWRSPKEALHEVSFTLQPGTITAVLGHNGAGKSSLLGCISGTLRTNAGSVTYGSQDLVAKPSLARKLCSFMPQAYAPIKGVTPLEALTCVAGVCGIPKATSLELAEKYLAALNISNCKNEKSDNLSGGYRRLVSLCMALVRNSPILLLDEPTNDVDPTRRKLVWNLLRDIAKQGKIIIVVTHNILEAQSSADRLLVLNQGNIVHDSDQDSLDTNREIMTVESYQEDLLTKLRTQVVQNSGEILEENPLTFALPHRDTFHILCGLDAALESGEITRVTIEKDSILYSYEELTQDEK